MGSRFKADAVSVYQNFAAYYDAYVGEFQADFPIYMGSLHPGARLLEIGCGTGRLLKPALELGYPVTGVDISEDMLARAEDKLGKYIRQGRLRLLNHNLANAPLEDKFGPVWVSFYTFNYLLDLETAANFLNNLRRSMASGAFLIMDLFYPASLQHPEQDGKWAMREIPGGEGALILKDRRTLHGKIEEREQIYESGDRQESIVTSRRFFDKQETAGLLAEAGFGCIEATDGYNKGGFHPVTSMERTGSSFMIKACC